VVGKPHPEGLEPGKGGIKHGQQHWLLPTGKGGGGGGRKGWRTSKTSKNKKKKITAGAPRDGNRERGHHTREGENGGGGGGAVWSDGTNFSREKKTDLDGLQNGKTPKKSSNQSSSNSEQKKRETARGNKISHPE